LLKGGDNMSLPVVALVGRPNVGKSTIFNRIINSRVAIVEDQPGVTRDRIYANAQWMGKQFVLVDTGGITFEDNVIEEQIKTQAEIAINEADVIVMLSDVTGHVTNLDETIAKILYKAKKPIILAINKADNPEQRNDIYDFYSLGLGDPIPVSGSMEGTTRDAIDTIFEKDGQKYTIVDTAGIRRKGKVYEKVEKYSVMRSISAIEQSDVAIIVIDASVGIIEQDKHIAGYAHDAGKGVIIAVNKWDVPSKTTTSMQDFVKVIRQEFQYLDYAPIVFVSAKTGQRIEDIVSLVKNVKENQQRRIQSSVLNDLLLDATRITPTPLVNGKRLRIYYMTQVAVVPPTFVVFVNDPELLHFSYKRFLINQMRQNFNFEGTPIKILARKRK